MTGGKLTGTDGTFVSVVQKSNISERYAIIMD